MEHSFEVYFEDNLIFYSNKNWIHPLFEFEKFLNNGNFHTEKLFVKDKIIGKAAAMLLIHFNIHKIHAKTLSHLGRDILDAYQISYTYDTLIDRIYCQTEELLHDISDTEIAYSMLKSRAADTHKEE
ncbi:MAG: DUF1893 domain-containing protein [Calditrichia bacterium]|nr:DUF1893 domain-containing protein [Calditrichia bacterium]